MSYRLLVTVEDDDGIITEWELADSDDVTKLGDYGEDLVTYFESFLYVHEEEE